MESIVLLKITLLPFSRSLSPIRTLPPKFSSFAVAPLRSSSRLSSISASAALSGAGGDGGGDDLGGGGGGDGDGGRDAEARSIAVGESDEVPDLGNDGDAIVLSVGGMACGGCAASVKRILESQPQVSLADVSFEKGTAFVWVVPEVKIAQNWQQELGTLLANHLTTCGFKSDLQGRA